MPSGSSRASRSTRCSGSRSARRWRLRPWRSAVSDRAGELRRRPPRTSATYAVRAPLARWLRAEAGRIPKGARVLDVGCGMRPYEPWFLERTGSYAGVDIASNPRADVVGTVEALPVED